MTYHCYQSLYDERHTQKNKNHVLKKNNSNDYDFFMEIFFSLIVVSFCHFNPSKKIEKKISRAQKNYFSEIFACEIEFVTKKKQPES